MAILRHINIHLEVLIAMIKTNIGKKKLPSNYHHYNWQLNMTFDHYKIGNRKKLVTNPMAIKKNSPIV
jgi:hypothetical protein